MEIKRPVSSQPIPDHAKRVFEGVVFDVYQWEQEMFDGTTATFERLDRPDTVEIFPIVDGKIMVQKQRQPDSEDWFYCPVGGRVDPGEEPLAAAKRETLEESGHVFTHWKHLSTNDKWSKMSYAAHTYLAHGLESVGEMNLDGGEQIELLFVTLDELLDMVDSGQLTRIDIEWRVKFVKAKYHKPTRKNLMEELGLPL